MLRAIFRKPEDVSVLSASMSARIFFQEDDRQAIFM
jgi:hypothetical protein